MQLAAKQPGRKPISRRRRFEVLEKYGYKCIYCGRGPEHGVVLQVDHAEPVARGGENDDENLVASCVDCNLGKRDRIVAVPTRTFLGWLRGSLRESEEAWARAKKAGK